MAAPSDLVRSARKDACPATGCAGVHSYTADETRWCWPGPSHPPRALDVELRTTPPTHLAVRLPDGIDFWRAWTELEVIAKLSDTPVLTLLGRGLLGAPSPAWLQVGFAEWDDVVACFGCAAGTSAD